MVSFRETWDNLQGEQGVFAGIVAIAAAGK